jgi:CheY-like chemotaxis protein
VLLVDDNFDLLNLTSLILEQAGAVVQTAMSAAVALERLPQFQPDVLISDIAMPEQDGYELLKKVRMIQPEGQIPAIALTARVSYSHRDDIQRAGFAYHAVKPVEPDELVRAILSVL